MLTHHHNPQRKTEPGPMAPTSIRLARKSTFLLHDQTDDIHEKSYNKSIQSIDIGGQMPHQVYQGDVRLHLITDTYKPLMCCKYTEDCDNVAAGFTDGTIRLFECSTGKCPYTLIEEDAGAYPGPVTAIKHRPVDKSHPVSSMLLASYVNGSIKCWKYKFGQCLYTIKEKRQTLGICYHPRNNKFITFGDDCRLNLYDEEAKTLDRSFYSSQRKGIMDGHTSRIYACVVNPRSPHELISGGWDNTVMCWDDRQPHATRHFSGVHICGEGLDFDKPGRQILTCSWQEGDNLQLWDYGSCKLIENIVPDQCVSKLYCGKFIPDTNMVLCGGADNNVLKLVDLTQKTTECSIRSTPGAVFAFDFGPVHHREPQPHFGKMHNELLTVPCVAFVSGKRLQIVDFG